MPNLTDAIIAEFDLGYRRLFGDQIGAEMARDLRLHAIWLDVRALRAEVAALKRGK